MRQQCHRSGDSTGRRTLPSGNATTTSQIIIDVMLVMQTQYILLCVFCSDTQISTSVALGLECVGQCSITQIVP